VYGRDLGNLRKYVTQPIRLSARDGDCSGRSGVTCTRFEMNSTNTLAPTSATQAKDRLYSQLASSIGRMSRAISHTADHQQKTSELGGT
jgi:hypothetical protein